MRLTLHRALSVRRLAKRSGRASAFSMISSSDMTSFSVMASLPGIANHAGAALFRPAGQEFSAALDNHRNVHTVSDPGTKPGVIPILTHGRSIGVTRYVQCGADDLCVIPATRKFRLAWFSAAVSVPPAAGLVSVEDVCDALRSNAYRIQRRAGLDVGRVPGGAVGSPVVVTAVVACPMRAVVSGGTRLVVLLPGPRLGRRLGCRRTVVTGFAVTENPLRALVAGAVTVPPI